MDAVLLERIGVHVFGIKWKTDLASLLNLSDRQISRYVIDNRPIPDTLRDGRNVVAALREILEAHQLAGAQLLAKLDTLASQNENGHVHAFETHDAGGAPAG